MEFGKGGRFAAQTQTPLTIANRMDAPGVSCKADMINDHTMSIAGKVDVESGTLKVTTTVGGQSHPAEQVCTAEGSVIRNTIPAARSDEQVTSLEVPAVVDQTRTFDVSLGPDGNATMSLQVEDR